MDSVSEQGLEHKSVQEIIEDATNGACSSMSL